jgi:hypothetical protein
MQIQARLHHVTHVHRTGTSTSWAGAAGISGARIVHGASVREEDETLKLRFLSTFRGNQQPLFLTATSEEYGALIFRVPLPAFLEVHVKPQAETLTIKICLRGKPHAEIYLKQLS